jgi:hypothetical protein
MSDRASRLHEQALKQRACSRDNCTVDQDEEAKVFALRDERKKTEKKELLKGEKFFQFSGFENLFFLSFSPRSLMRDCVGSIFL